MTRSLPFLMMGVLLLAGCGGDKGQAATGAPAAGGQAGGAPAAAGSDLTPFELANGIGPVKEEIPATPIDKALAEKGEKIFEEKCSACHKLEERYVGPALGDVTQRRSLAYVMNMILNPDGMYTRHPEAKKLLAEYLTQMPNQGLSREDARAVVEHLRKEGSEGK
jgi:mono/diheme cytochrome c family protein